VSNELSNYCGADRQPTVDDPGRFGALRTERSTTICRASHRRGHWGSNPVSPTDITPSERHFSGSSRGSAQHTRRSAGVEPDRWALWSTHIGQPWFASLSAPQGLDAPEGTVSPSSPIVLVSGALNRSGDILSVELHQPADSPSFVMVVWPAKQSLRPHPKRMQRWRRQWSAR
jgi:hypothetical protein